MKTSKLASSRSRSYCGRRKKDLERENALLKQLVADMALDKAIPQEASKLNF